MVVIPKEHRLLIIRPENVIKSVLQRHVSLKQILIRHEIRAPQIPHNSSISPKLGPLRQFGVFIDNLAFLEVQRRVRGSVRNLNERLILPVKTTLLPNSSGGKYRTPISSTFRTGYPKSQGGPICPKRAGISHYKGSPRRIYTLYHGGSAS